MIVVLIKSVLAGLGAMAVVMLAMALYVQGVKARLPMSAPASDTVLVDVGIDFRAILFTSVLMFAAGFWWQYRKAR